MLLLINFAALIFPISKLTQYKTTSIKMTNRKTSEHKAIL